MYPFCLIRLLVWTPLSICRRAPSRMFPVPQRSPSADKEDNPCEEMAAPRYRKGPSTCFDNNHSVRPRRQQGTGPASGCDETAIVEMGFPSS